MANTAIANDMDQELFSEFVEPLVQPLLIHMVAQFVNGEGQELFPANKCENFVGMEEVKRKFKETVCCLPSKLTFHWIHTGGIRLRSRRQFIEHQND